MRRTAVITALVLASASSCGSDVDTTAVATTAEEALVLPVPTCRTTTLQDKFFRPTEGWTVLNDSVGDVSWRSVQTMYGSYQAIAAPYLQTTVTISFIAPYPTCDATHTLADDILAHGVVTVDGSTEKVLSFARMSGVRFNATVVLTRYFQSSAFHTVTLTLPQRDNAVALTSSVFVEAEITNPFTFLSNVYSQPRCLNCHSAGDKASLGALHPNPMALEPGDFEECEHCHSVVESYYKVPYCDFADSWRAPPFSMNINWGALSPQERCNRTVTRVQTPAHPEIDDGIRDHFQNDKRVRWAVEDGNPHDALSDCHETTTAECGVDEECNTAACVDSGYCPTAWPHDYDKLVRMANDFAFYTITNPDAPCGNINTAKYSLYESPY